MKKGSLLYLCDIIDYAGICDSNFNVTKFLHSYKLGKGQPFVHTLGIYFITTSRKSQPCVWFAQKAFRHNISQTIPKHVHVTYGCVLWRRQGHQVIILYMYSKVSKVLLLKTLNLIRCYQVHLYSKICFYNVNSMHITYLALLLQHNMQDLYWRHTFRVLAY